MTIFSGRCSIRLSFRSIIEFTAKAQAKACVTGLLACLAVFAQAPPNFDDDIKPLIQRRCLPCHSSSEMRASLNLETFQGVLKGGGSGDIVKPGRVNASMLYKVLAREEGVPQMPLGGPKLPDADIAKVREWVQGGLLENAGSKPLGPAVQSLMSRLVKASEQGELQGAIGALFGITAMVGPGLFTQVFAASIDEHARWPFPGAAFLVAAALMLAAMIVSLRVSREAALAAPGAAQP